MFNVTLSYSLLRPLQHRVAVLDKVTDFLLFLGKLLIVGIVGRSAAIFRPNVSVVYFGERSVRDP